MTKKSVMYIILTILFACSAIAFGGGVVYHDADEIVAGSFGSGNYKITGELNVTSITHTPQLCLNGDCQTSWPAGGGGYWNLDGINLSPSDLSYRVGIGMNNLGYQLDVNGTIRAISQTNISQQIQMRGNQVALVAYGRNLTLGSYGWGKGIKMITTDDDGTQHDALFADKDGNVGIGTTTPNQKLHIQSDENIYAKIETMNKSTRSSLILFNNVGRYLEMSLFSNESTNNFMNDPTNMTAYLRAGNAIKNLKIGTISAAPLIFGTGNTEQMRIDGAGNVGIGTTTPNAPLHVNGTISQIDNQSSFLYVGRYSDVDNKAYIVAGDKDRDHNVSLALRVRLTDGMMYDGLIIHGDTGVVQAPYSLVASKIGIGTTFPNYKLEVVGTASSTEQAIRTYSDTDGHNSILRLSKSHNDTSGGLTETVDTETIGTIQFEGISSNDVLKRAAKIVVTQNGSSGVAVPGKISFITSSSAAEDANEALAIDSAGNVCINGDCRDAWPAGSGYWSRTGTFVYPSNIDDDIGIGTASPTADLHVYRNGANSVVHIGAHGVGKRGILYLKANTSSTTVGNEAGRIGFIALDNNTNEEVYSDIYVDLVNSTDGYEEGVMYLNVKKSGKTIADSTVMTLKGGNVGIGTRTPAERLHVNGSIRVNAGQLQWETPGSITYNAYYDPVDGRWEYIAEDQASYVRLENDGTIRFSHAVSDVADNPVTWDESLRLDKNDIIIYGNNLSLTQGAGATIDGKVGIGTTSPSNNLDINATASDQGITLTNGAGNTLAMLHRQTDGARLRLYEGTEIATNLRTDGGDSWIKFGELGIGTTSPTSRLHVNGTVNITENLYIGGNITSYGADFAEWMFSSQELEAGDVVCHKGEEIGRCDKDSDKSVVGIVSVNPTIIGNLGNGNYPIGITGLVKVKVNGPVEAYDLLTSSSNPGYAKKATVDDFGAVVGKALESCQEATCEIECLVGLN